MGLLLIDPVTEADRRPPPTLRVGASAVVRRRDGTALAVHRTGRRRFVGHLAACSHCAGALHAEGAWLCCPLDGSLFAAATGEVLHGPAARPLRRVDVRVSRAPLIPG
jgi:nitrite reductase/ring-hydroxylating ferredoxin subunit